MQLTVLFNGQFWVGILERRIDGRLFAVQQLFGPEPHDQEILEFVNHQLFELMRGVSQGISDNSRLKQPKNPKRMAREAAKAMQAQGISTKAQQALSAELELRKVEHHRETKAEKEALLEYKRETRRNKAKARHRGH